MSLVRGHYPLVYYVLNLLVGNIFRLYLEFIRLSYTSINDTVFIWKLIRDIATIGCSITEQY